MTPERESGAFSGSRAASSGRCERRIGVLAQSLGEGLGYRDAEWPLARFLYGRPHRRHLSRRSVRLGSLKISFIGADKIFEQSASHEDGFRATKQMITAQADAGPKGSPFSLPPKRPARSRATGSAGVGSQS